MVRVSPGRDGNHDAWTCVKGERLKCQTGRAALDFPLARRCTVPKSERCGPDAVPRDGPHCRRRHWAPDPRAKHELLLFGRWRPSLDRARQQPEMRPLQVLDQSEAGVPASPEQRCNQCERRWAYQTPQ